MREKELGRRDREEESWGGRERGARVRVHVVSSKHSNHEQIGPGPDGQQFHHNGTQLFVLDRNTFPLEQKM